MGTKTLVAVFSLVMIGTIFGCSTNRREMTSMGMFGRYEIRRMEHSTSISGHANGIFFLGSGKISGQIGSERQLQFYWGRTPDEFISTTLPYHMFRFVIDNSKKAPTVEFVFNSYWLGKHTDPYSQEDKSNPNFWLVDNRDENSKLRTVIVRISQTDFEKGIYLPN